MWSTAWATMLELLVIFSKKVAKFNLIFILFHLYFCQKKSGGGDGEYYSNPGEVVIWKRCPKNFDFYIMDDDVSAGVMQMPDGTGLYLSTAAKAGHNGAKGFMKSQ